MTVIVIFWDPAFNSTVNPVQATEFIPAHVADRVKSALKNDRSVAEYYLRDFLASLYAEYDRVTVISEDFGKFHCRWN